MNEVDAYIKGFPVEVQERLTEIINIILELAPVATERICMRMPTYDLNGNGWFILLDIKNTLAFIHNPKAYSI